MVPHPVNQSIRWLRRIGIFLTEVFASFFDIHRSDNVLTSGGKVATKVSSRVLYKILDYWTILASAAIVAHMKKEGFAFWPTAGALWLFDIIVAAAFVLPGSRDLARPHGYPVLYLDYHLRARVRPRNRLALTGDGNSPPPVLFIFRQRFSCYCYYLKI